ncbi:MAG: siroheme synthase CysG [Pseudomonadota bacterium]
MSQRKPELCQSPSVQALSVLPVFFDLQGKTVLFAGFGEGAFWKLQLVLAAGAVVELAASVHGPEIETLVKQHPDCIRILPRDWVPNDFQSKVLAIGAFDDETDAESFYRAARHAGVPANVIDKKEFCDFQFGSIVNRSPVVVSVSTSGAAPALTQVIRARIEALLPTELGLWATVAEAVRGHIKRRVPDASERRRLWQAFAHAAWVEPASKAHRFFDNLDPHQKRKGHVTLVGAGPGAGDLLTLRAVRAMQTADVILFDDLIADDVLDLARREAKRMLVGKRGHRASCRQEDINALMIDLAKKGKRVVRLKSGDPMIFGRAGEEIAALEADDISVEIVPGVTAALAAASSLGVSLTHRDCAQGVTLVTAHSKQGVLPDLNWSAQADPQKTLMVYMGGKTAGELAIKLIEHGLDGSTPVVVMESLSRKDERCLPMGLGELAQQTLLAEGPVLLGIGQVFAAARARPEKQPSVSAA